MEMAVSLISMAELCVFLSRQQQWVSSQSWEHWPFRWYFHTSVVVLVGLIPNKIGPRRHFLEAQGQGDIGWALWPYWW